MKRQRGARVALITVLGALALSFAAFGPVYAGNHGDHGNKNAGCNQNKETREHRYDADCDGSASENGGGNENGSGNENGGGKPCAGCVGNADNKHPPGQEPDENDRNKGYECDDNKGVGADRGTGNPAHTGCREDSTQTETPTPSPTRTRGSTPTPSTSPPGGGSPSPSDTVSPNVITKCDANEEMPGTQVCGNIIGGGDDADHVGESSAERNPRGGVLPFTGASLLMVVLIGGGLVAAGIAAIRRKD